MSEPKPRRTALRILLALLAAVALPAALTGGASTYGHDSDHHHHATTWTVKVGNESQDHAIQGMAFLPKNIWIDQKDTIRWVANSAEIHTVAFLATGQKLTPFNPGDPKQTGRVGGSWYDGHSYYNSGVLTTMADPLFPGSFTSYSLTFPKVGTYTYYCLVHGMAMVGTVHVRHQGAPYPYTQAQYDRYSGKQAWRILADGYRLWHETAEHATRYRVFEGADDGVAMVMRFIRPTVVVHVGQTVTFKNVGMAAPHTVTFGPEPANIFAPVGDPKHYHGGTLSSGIQTPGQWFSVTFTKAGTYSYICALHDMMGMVGKVIVTR
ncbi:MAG: cupredoxin domain-containing protein [Amnibacterium sp.]